MVRKTSIFIITLLILFAFGCGENAEPVEVVDVPEAATVKTKDIMSEMRKNEDLGAGGEFLFTYNGEEFAVNWGYADFRVFEATNNSRLTLLSNAVGGESFPILRLLVPGTVAKAEELIGQTAKAEKLTLKFEKKKKSGLKGSGQVTITAITEGFIEGTFSGEMENGSKIEGKFRAKLNLPE